MLAASLAVRCALVLQGGQYFFGDETRYDRGVQLYQALQSGDFERVRGLAILPEHMLFTWWAAILTAGQHLLAQLTPYGDWAHHPVYANFTMWIGALLLSLFSTLNLFLIHRLARVLGASDEEAAWTLLLMATSSTAFYYARHLLPYEGALSCALLALIIGLGGSSWQRALGCGFIAALSYGFYNGYWYLVPVIWLTHTFVVCREPGGARLAVACGVGVALGLALPAAFGTVVDGDYYWAIVRDFSKSVRQGSMAEGWSLPWAYFWHAEGVAGVAVILFILTAGVVHWRRKAPIARRVGLALAALVTSYALLVLTSNGLRVFTVYGRTVKPFVPLICLLGGWAFAQILPRSPRIKVLVASALVIAGTIHFQPHFSLVFPREIEIAVLRNWGNPKHTLNVSGSIYIPLTLPVTRPELALVNAQLLYPVHYYLGYPPGRTIARFAHPLEFLPYQYEGFHPRERALLRTHDISIRLIALSDPAAVPDDLPPPLRARSSLVTEKP